MPLAPASGRRCPTVWLGGPLLLLCLLLRHLLLWLRLPLLLCLLLRYLLLWLLLPLLLLRLLLRRNRQRRCSSARRSWCLRRCSRWRWGRRSGGPRRGCSAFLLCSGWRGGSSGSVNARLDGGPALAECSGRLPRIEPLAAWRVWTLASCMPIRPCLLRRLCWLLLHLPRLLRCSLRQH